MDDAVRLALHAARGGRPYRIFVTNANKAWQASRDRRLREWLDSAELVVPEYAMYWGAHRLGRSGVHHVGGIRLMIRLLDAAESEGLSVYLLGARPEVTEALTSLLRRNRPELQIAGSHHGYVEGKSWDRVVAELDATAPHFVFVGMGSPLQERRIQEIRARAPRTRVLMGVGGSFDVLSGHKKDAPAWARGRGIEWLFRLAQDPRRLWKRYLISNPWFVGRVARDWWNR